MTQQMQSHRPPLNRYSRKVLVSERLPEKMGYYRASFKRSKMLNDQLFIPNDIACKKLWAVQIEWWSEEIPEPYAITKEEAIEKLHDYYLPKILLECYFVGKGDKNRVPTQEEMDTLKKVFTQIK